MDYIYVYEKIFKSIHSVISLSHGVLEGIQLFEVDILWLAGIKPHNMVSHFCVFNHVVVVCLVRLLPIPPSLLALIFLLNSCSLVSNHPTLCPSNDAESTPFVNVLKHPPRTIQDVVFNILTEVGCPDMSSKSIREYVVVHEPGACEVVDQHFLSSTVNLKLQLHDDGCWAHPLDVRDARAPCFHPPVSVEILFVAHAARALCSFGRTAQQPHIHVVVPESCEDYLIRQ